MTYLKAAAAGLVAGLVAGLSSLAASWDDGALSGQDWLYAVVSLLVGTGLVAAVPSRPR